MATTAEIYAQAKRDEAAKQLQNLYDANEQSYKQQTNAATANTQNILNQLTQQGTDYKTQMERDARSAYVNKILGKQTVTNQLNRLGLYNSGYGVSALGAQENTFNRNISDLQNALSKNLAVLDTQKATAQTELQGILANLASNYANQKNSISEYINNQLTSIYNNAYNQKYQEEQDELERIRQAELLAYQKEQDAIANKLAQEKFEYQKQQDAIANAISSSTRNYYSGGDSYVPSGGYEVQTDYYKGQRAENVGGFGYMGSDYNGTAYQPKGVYVNGKAYQLEKTGKKAGQVFGNGFTNDSGVNVAGQNLWKAHDHYFIWNGTQNRYQDVTAQYREYLNKKFKNGKDKYGYLKKTVK